MIAPEQFERRPLAGFGYRRLLNLYPGAFRDRYAAEMVRGFEEDWSRAAERGFWSRLRYCLHVLGDAARTMPHEWSAALPLPTKLGLLGFGTIVALDALGHQWLTIAYWLLLCHFVISLRVVLQPSRPGGAWPLLLAGGLWAASLWLEQVLAGIGYSFYGDRFATFGSWLYVAVCVLLLVGPDPAPDSRDAAMPPAALRHGVGLRGACGLFCVATNLVALIWFGRRDGIHAWLLTLISLFLVKQLTAIWRSPDHGANPEFQTKSA